MNLCLRGQHQRTVFVLSEEISVLHELILISVLEQREACGHEVLRTCQRVLVP